MLVIRKGTHLPRQCGDRKISCSILSLKLKKLTTKIFHYFLSSHSLLKKVNIFHKVQRKYYEHSNRQVCVTSYVSFRAHTWQKYNKGFTLTLAPLCTFFNNHSRTIYFTQTQHYQLIMTWSCHIQGCKKLFISSSFIKHTKSLW